MFFSLNNSTRINYYRIYIHNMYNSLIQISFKYNYTCTQLKIIMNAIISSVSALARVHYKSLSGALVGAKEGDTLL